MTHGKCQVAGNLSFYDLDLDLGDLGGEITWSVPQDWGVFCWEILNLSDVEVDFFWVGNFGKMSEDLIFIDFIGLIDCMHT